MQACYARQSIDKKDSISVETQLEKARQECSPEEPIEEYTDRGFSGKNTNRPEFQRLIKDVREGKISRIVVYKIDRFSRSLMDFSNAWDILSSHKVDFISVNEKFDTSTPIGKAMLFILMVFAQLERETIAERVTDNYYARAAQGSWMGGPAPYGFDIGRLDVMGRKVPTLQPNENMVNVKRIFRLYAEREGIALGEIAKLLNNEGIRAARRRTWNNVSLARLLHNPVYVKADADIYAYYKSLGVKINVPLSEFSGIYAGMLIGKRGASSRQRKKMEEAVFTVANWEGVIEADQWLACQGRLAKNKQIKNTGKGRHTWLSGLLKCGQCGRSVRICIDRKNPSKRRYMMCTGRIDHNCGNLITVKLDEIEKEAEERLTEILDHCKDEPVVVEAKGLSAEEKMELKKMEEQAANLMNVIASGNVSEYTLRYIDDEIKKIESRRCELTERLQEQSVKRHVTYEHIDFRTLSFEERKIVAAAYIKEVMIVGEDVEIVWIV